MASEVETLVDVIYESVAFPERWSAVAHAMVQCAGAVSCSIQVRSAACAKVIDAYGYKNLIPADYERHFARRDVRARMLMRLAPNERHVLHHHLPPRRFTASAYYNDYFRHVTDGFWSSAWWSPMWKVASVDKPVLAFGVHRPRASDPDDPALGRMLALVTPHLRQAGLMAQSFSDLDARLTAAQAALDGVDYPIILIDRSGRAKEANRSPQTLLNATKLIWIRPDGAIQTIDPKITKKIEAAIHSALGKNRRHAVGTVEVLLSDPGSGEMLSLGLAPLAGRGSATSLGAMLTVREAAGASREISIYRLVARFRLTPAEERLARLLVLGNNLDRAADALEIRRSTAATQLRSIFAKTGTHRQAELVLLALELALAGN